MRFLNCSSMNVPSRDEASDAPKSARSGKKSKLRYRLNVAAILQNREGRILVCERVNTAGAWQFPQGGVKKNETLEAALTRELREEISLDPSHYRVLTRKGPYHYLFRDEATRRKKRADGQEQHYFLAELIAPESERAINVRTAKPEFRAVKWIAPREFDLRWLPKMKREVYRAVLRDFFSVDCAENSSV